MATTSTSTSTYTPDAQNVARLREAMDSASSPADVRSFLEQTVASLTNSDNLMAGNTSDAYKTLVSYDKQQIADINAALTQSAPTLSAQASGSAGTIDTGRYTITASSQQDGSLNIVDNQTNKSVTIWGDPHIMVNGRTIADFQAQGMNLELADGTLIHIDPTPEKNGVSHIASVTVQKGTQQAQFTGNNGTFQNGATMQKMTTSIMTASTVSAWSKCPTLTFGTNGKLSTTNTDGSAKAVLTAQADGSQTNIDKMAGGFVF